jgi:hypothetical protein
MKLTPPPTVERKPYQRPQVVYEARLEAQAGSPLGDTLGDLLDPSGVEK